jgi:predicted PurR-regulated permease PerM
VATVSKPLKAEEVRGFALPVIAFGVVIAVLYLGRMLFITASVAVIIAFLLEPFVTLLMQLRIPRPLASFIVCAAALLVVYLMGVGAYTQVSGLIEDLPRFRERISEIVDKARQRIESMEQATYQFVVPARQREQQAQPQSKPPETSRRRRRNAEPAPVPAAVPGAPAPIPEVRIHDDRTPIGEFISSHLSSVYEILLMSSFIPFLVYFMLSWRDHMYRSFLQFFHGEDRMVAARTIQGIADMVRAFVVGNFMLGLLLAFATSLAFWVLRVPYPILAGPLSGFLSLVPYVGLPLALAPPFFTALTAATGISAFVLIAVVVAGLHLLALNLLYPKLVGSRVHLNPLVVTFALMIWGFLWSAAGLLLAIPLTAGIKAVCDNVKTLRPYGRFLGD